MYMSKSQFLPPKANRVHHNLACLGLPEIPLLGIHDEKHARAGLAPHVHPGLMEICYLTRGERVYHVNGRDYRFKGNEVFVTYPDEIHGSGRHPHGKGLLYWMQVRLPKRPAPFLAMAAREAWPLVSRLRRLQHRRFAGNHRLKRLFEEVCGLLRNGDQGLVRLETAIRLIQWLILVAQCAEKESAQAVSEDIRRVLDQVEALEDEPVSVETLSATARLSPSRFKAKFKEQIGIPPAEYMIRRRVEKARQMLGQGCPVTEVAFALGFSSSQYLATVFKRITNLRPKDVLKKR